MTVLQINHRWTDR